MLPTLLENETNSVAQAGGEVATDRNTIPFRLRKKVKVLIEKITGVHSTIADGYSNSKLRCMIFVRRRYKTSIICIIII